MLIHTAAEGETWSDIARIYDLPEVYLKRLNLSYMPLVTGQELIIAYPAAVHTAAAGETLFSIAQNYGTDTAALLRNNPYLARGLDAGDEVVISYDTKREGYITLNGYCYTFIGRALYAQILPYFSYITIFTYGFDDNAELIPPYPSDDYYIRTALEYGTAPLMHLSTLTAGGVFSSALAADLLSSDERRDKLIDNVVANIEAKGYRGADIDFEYLPAQLREPYAEFTRLLREALNARGYILITALAPKTSAGQAGLLYEGHDYRLLGESSNYVMPMTYEWGYAYSEPMAVAPINSVRRVAEYAVTEIPAEKILLGLPFYGYDWALPYIGGVTVADSLSPDRALSLARRYGGIIRFDEASASPYMTYTDNGTEHIVWFESPKSVSAKLALISELSLAGGGIWSTDRPFAQGYMTINLTREIARTI
ncbi:MAG: LysM peptidoglycan-binding domain-containing protein [Firmicutes bacterium]|nr:LysM peptidoglycan-binding domain-containing protein [Bacillota bacterium]